MDSLGILILLIVIGGFFALTEMGLASSRKARLRQLADNGDINAARALLIKETPSRFLAATQTGLTAASLLAGIFGESAMALGIEHGVEQWLPIVAGAKQQIALIVTVAVVTAVSIVFGEIIPKRIALAYPEDVARLVAPFMTFFIWLLSPLIRLLSWSADLILKALPLRSAPDVTSIEDILAYVDEGKRAGSIAPEESHLLGNVFRLEDRHVAAVMTSGNYHTVGGFVLTSLARIPKRADKFVCAGWEFEVVDMEGNRVDEILATRLPDPGAALR